MFYLKKKQGRGFPWETLKAYSYKVNVSCPETIGAISGQLMRRKEYQHIGIKHPDIHPVKDLLLKVAIA